MSFAWDKGQNIFIQEDFHYNAFSVSVPGSFYLFGLAG